MRKFLKQLLAGALWASAASSIAGFAANLAFPCELASHFRPQYAVIQIASAAIFVCARSVKLAVLAAFFAILNLIIIVPIYLPKPQASLDGEKITFISANLEVENTITAPALAYFNTRNADVIGLLEFTPRWQSAFRQLIELYPYRLLDPRNGFYGIALLSKFPMHPKLISFAGSTPAILADIQISDASLKVLLIHTPAPSSAGGMHLRNKSFREMAKMHPSLKEPFLLIGDFNSSSASRAFQELIRATGLVDSRQGFGIQPSWPNFFFPLWVPIDHALVSPDISVINRRVGPNIRSDHYPIELQLRIPKRNRL